jgi:hypothetical protein
MGVNSSYSFEKDPLPNLPRQLAGEGEIISLLGERRKGVKNKYKYKFLWQN